MRWGRIARRFRFWSGSRRITQRSRGSSRSGPDSAERGNVERKTGRAAEGLESSRKSLEIRRKLAGERPGQFDLESESGGQLQHYWSRRTRRGRFYQMPSSCFGLPSKSARSRRRSIRNGSISRATGRDVDNIAKIIWNRRSPRTREPRSREPSPSSARRVPPRPITLYRRHLSTELGCLLKACQALGRDDEVEQIERELKEMANARPSNPLLDAKLEAVLKGAESTSDDAERLKLAFRAYEKDLFVASAKCTRRLSVRPKLAEDRQTQHAYNAACAAALASTGKGNDAAALDNDAKAKLRSQAHDWLEGRACHLEENL